MASEELLSQYVDRQAIDSDTDYLLSRIKSVFEAFEKLSTVRVDLSAAKGSEDLFNKIKESNQLLQQSERLSNADAKASIANAKAKAEEAKARKLNADAAAREADAAGKSSKIAQEEGKAALLNAKAKAEEAKARKLNADAAVKEEQASRSKTKAASDEEKQQRLNDKLNEELLNDYLQLSKAYSDAALKAKNYALRLGENHPVTIEAVKDAKAMYDVLLRVDQAVGQNGRNVGNYKSAFDGLSVSFTQVARELPSLTISAQQFFLAISNNLPMVADEITKAKKEIAALKAEGKDAPTLFKRIGDSLFSWQVGLSIGITILTAYVPKLYQWVKGVLDGSEALRKATEDQIRLNDAWTEFIRLSDDYFNRTKTDVGSKQRELEIQLAYARAQGKSQKELLALEIAIGEERRKNAYFPFVDSGGQAKLDSLEKSLFAATAAYSFFITEKKKATSNEDEQKALDLEERRLKSELELVRTQYADQKAIVEEYYNSNRDLKVKELEQEKLLKEERELLFTDELRYRADKLKTIANIEQGGSDIQIKARKQAFELEKEIARLERDDAVIKAKDKAEEIVLIEKKYRLELLKLQEGYEIDSFIIKSKAAQRQKELDDEINKDFKEQADRRVATQLAAAEKEKTSRLLSLEEGKQLELTAAARRYEEQLRAAGINQEKIKDAEKKYAIERAQIEQKYAISVLQTEIDLAEKLIAIRRGLGLDTTEAESALTKAKIALANLYTQAKIDNDKKEADSELTRLQKLEKGIQRVANLYQTVQQIATSVIDNITTAEKNRIEETIEGIEKKQKADIEAVNASAISEQEKADKIAIINARAAAQKEEQARRQKQLDIKEAELKKALSITQIIINTAVGVTSALAKGDLIEAVAVGVLGAAQLAVAAAAPIPKYKHGRGKGKKELAFVGDGGQHEVIQKADGTAYLTPDSDTLVQLGADDVVHPSVDKYIENAQKLSNKPVELKAMQKADENMALLLQMRAIERTIANKRENHIELTDQGFRGFVKSAGARTEYINKSVYE